MFQTENIAKIDEKSFIMHFVDNHGGKWTKNLSKKIHAYDTVDGSNCDLKLRINTMAKTVFIDVTIQYGENVIDNPNTLNELIQANEKRFTNFYVNATKKRGK